MYWKGVGHRVLRNVYFWGVHFNSTHIWTPNFEWLQMKWNMISCYNSLPPNRYHCLRVDWVIREGLMLTMFTTKMILTCVATEGRSHDNVVNNDNVVNINNVDNLCWRQRHFWQGNPNKNNKWTTQTIRTMLKGITKLTILTITTITLTMSHGILRQTETRFHRP